jgi:hypothetical protein
MIISGIKTISHESFQRPNWGECLEIRRVGQLLQCDSEGSVPHRKLAGIIFEAMMFKTKGICILSPNQRQQHGWINGMPKALPKTRGLWMAARPLRAASTDAGFTFVITTFQWK